MVIPGPHQMRGTGGTLNAVWELYRDRGHPPDATPDTVIATAPAAPFAGRKNPTASRARETPFAASASPEQNSGLKSVGGQFVLPLFGALPSSLCRFIAVSSPHLWPELPVNQCPDTT